MQKNIIIVILLIWNASLVIGQTKKIEIEHLYSMKVLKELKYDGSLNDEASLEYSNYESEKYIIVIHESKSEFIEVFTSLGLYNDSMNVIDCFAEAQLDALSEVADVFDHSETEEKKSHGMPLRTIVMEATIEGVDPAITYYLGFLEGEDTMYTVMAWTIHGSKNAFKREAAKMIKSLKEL